jgi:predicted  nucleic acid-binding Zn-ribbon protein
MVDELRNVISKSNPDNVKNKGSNNVDLQEFQMIIDDKEKRIKLLDCKIISLKEVIEKQEEKTRDLRHEIGRITADLESERKKNATHVINKKLNQTKAELEKKDGEITKLQTMVTGLKDKILAEIEKSSEYRPMNDTNIINVNTTQTQRFMA